MDAHEQALLERWRSIRYGDGERRINSMLGVLRLLGAVLALAAGLGVVYAVHPAIVAVTAAICGWVIAEAHALQSRIAMWPLLEKYIDWQRVDVDADAATDNRPPAA